MNWLDILLVLIIGYSFVAGLLKGITRIGIGFVAVIAGFLCALWFYGSAAAPLARYISSPQVRNLAGFALIFFGILMLGGLLSWVLGKLFKWVHLSWLDRLLGGAFGFLRGLLISTILVLTLMAFTPKPPPASVVRSRVAPYVVDAARIMAAAAPHDLKKAFQESYDKMKGIWADMVRKGVSELPSEKL